MTTFPSRPKEMPKEIPIERRLPLAVVKSKSRKLDPVPVLGAASQSPETRKILRALKTRPDTTTAQLARQLQMHREVVDDEASKLQDQGLVTTVGGDRLRLTRGGYLLLEA